MAKIVLFPAKERRIKQMLEQEQQKTWNIVDELKHVRKIEEQFHKKNRRDCFILGVVTGFSLAYVVLQTWIFIQSGG